MTFDEVVKCVKNERLYQDLKWGSPAERGHEVGAWLALMRHHLFEAERAWATKAYDYDALNELRKVLAIGFACCEQHGAIERNPVSIAVARASHAVATSGHETSEVATLGQSTETEMEG